ncbi:DnaJ domain-containing protein [Candidatus Bartonella raoultii]|uniref:DnaJ domain-containing protein n=1 Tax=Bartonella raoultii TaxID=1457020 RepID=A0ABS7I9G7_9HYPH|nr:DnaJ domain-containing protein [Bartonella raoultii]
MSNAFNSLHRDKIKKTDYYKILNISFESDDKQIKYAFRKLAMQYHPDHNVIIKKETEKFREICEAYEILKDPQKRAAYDQFYHEIFKNNHTTVENNDNEKLKTTEVVIRLWKTEWDMIICVITMFIAICVFIILLLQEQI